MTISNPSVLKGFYNATKAVGAKSINSDAYFEIAGFESLSLLTKQFPWPVTGSQGEIDVPTPLGASMFEQQQLKIAQQGPITFTETQAGHVAAFMSQVARNGGKFQATAYEGVPDSFARAAKLVDCFFVPDASDRDWESRSTLTLINGTLFFHFFDEWIPGNRV